MRGDNRCLPQDEQHSGRRVGTTCSNVVRVDEVEQLGPTLERLDRAFINLAWNDTLPDTNLSSLTCTTSNQVPL